MNRMRGYALVLLAAMLSGLLLTAPAVAQAPVTQVLYNITFDGETAGTAPTTHAANAAAPRQQISSIFTGSPTIANGFSPLAGNVMVLDSNGLGGAAFEQTRLRMDDFPVALPANGFYVIENDIVIGNLAPGSFLRFFVDAPQIRFVDFLSDGSLRGFVSGPNVGDPPIFDAVIGSFEFNAVSKLRLEVDLAADNWTIFLNGAQLHSGTFGGAAAISSIRHSLFTAESSGSAVAVDNIHVTVAAAPPLPTSGLLYNVTFDADKAGLPPAVHVPGAPAPRLAPTALNGTPTVETAHGSLLGQPVVLDGTNDSVHLTMLDFPGGVIPDGLVTLDADVFIGSGAASGAFNLFFFDESFARAVWLEIRTDGSMTIFEGTSGNPGSFPLDVPVAVRVEINLAAETYRIFLDGTPVLSRAFNTPRSAITQITANVNSAASLAAAVDNVSVSIAPAPPPDFPSPVVYKVDFNLDAQAGLPATHPPFAPTPRTAIADHGGDPTVVASFGALADQPLLFDGFGDEVQDFILFSFDDLPEGSPTTGLFVYSADVLVESDPEPLVSEALQINLQGTSTALSIDFRNSGLFLVERVTGTLVETMDTGNFPLDSRLRLRMEVDRALASYKVILNGVLVSSGSLDAPELLRSFAHIQPTSMRAAMDNVEISIGGTPSQFVECPANDTELARIFTDAGDGGKDAYILTFDPETSDGGQKDLAGSGLCPGPSFPGDGTDPTVGYIRPCPDNDCFGPEGRPAFGGLFHHRVRVSGSVCTVQCYIIDGVRWCREVCVESSLGG